METFCRITRPYELLEPFFTDLLPKVGVLVVYEHSADEEVKRTHIHALIQDCSVDTLTLKKRLEKRFGHFEKEDWAFPKKNLSTIPTIIAYMSKGHLQPKLVKGIPNTHINDYMKLWIEPKDLKKRKKPTYDEIVTEVQENISKLDYMLVEQLHEPDVRFVAQQLIAVLNKHKIICGQYKTRDLLDSILRLNNPEGFLEILISKYRI